VRKKKTWSRKNIEFVCGYCHSCNKELLNTMGGWIINGEKKYFCHDGRDGSCFDNYCNNKGVENAGKKNEEAYEEKGKENEEG